VEIAKLYQRLNATIIYVTHDQVEAMTLAGRIVIMNHGIVQQVGSPIEVYRKPVNLFVAGFIGSPTMNFLSGKLSIADGVSVFSNESITMPIPAFVLPQKEARDGREVVLGIRPDDVLVERPGGEKCSGKIEGVLEVCELLGHRENLYLKVGGQRLLATVEAFFNRSPGSAVSLCFNYQNMHVFDKSTEQRISE